MDEVDEPDPVVDWESDVYDAMRDPRGFEQLVVESYCELCEQEGHTARTCPTRDDSDEYELNDLDPGPEVDDKGGMSEIRRSLMSDAAVPLEYWPA